MLCFSKLAEVKFKTEKMKRPIEIVCFATYLKIADVLCSYLNVFSNADINQNNKPMHTEQYSNQLLMALQAMDLSSHYGALGVAAAAMVAGGAYYYLQNRFEPKEHQIQRSSVLDFKHQTKLVSVRKI